MEHIVIKPIKKQRSLELKELWKFRELLVFLVWKGLRVKYSQTLIGILWVIVQPILTIIIFSIIFGKFAKLPDNGFPYIILVFTALLPWNLFSNSISGAGPSLIANNSLITKIYFPRIIIPMSKVIENIIDFCISCSILIVLMVLFNIRLGVNLIFMPIFVIWTMILAFGIALWLSAAAVKYRDVLHAIPFLLQIWLFISPVAYSFTLIPGKWRLLYSLNPVVGIIEGFRWSMLGRGTDIRISLLFSAIFTIVISVTGAIYFLKTEKTFADVI